MGELIERGREIYERPKMREKRLCQPFPGKTCNSSSIQEKRATVVDTPEERATAVDTQVERATAVDTQVERATVLVHRKGVQQ